MVWICFRGLNLFYYDESILSTLASVVGRSIKVDSNTKGVWRGHFACVEIDLMKPVVGNIWLKDFWCKVEYESIHRNINRGLPESALDRQLLLFVASRALFPK
ncbi:hypothetical protein JHK82_033949 [Glycine max]|nr:hypothetical protein JHK82_033949 [Glycine max]